mmetsp:Transcript_11746/g.30180  ORF Transcript_11746/g.30180 Transcript_11746/m.30180 type:complete len:198 (+) Transcript_11746:41-634(+)
MPRSSPDAYSRGYGRRRSPSPDGYRRRSRSRSPPRRDDRDRRDYGRDYGRDDRADRRDRDRRTDYDDRDRGRERERSRDRGRDDDRYRGGYGDDSGDREQAPLPKPSAAAAADEIAATLAMAKETSKDGGPALEVTAEEDEEDAMMKMMGFSTLASTKGKKVEGNLDPTLNVNKKKRRYRQYMNRKGGFNRLLANQQ